MEVILVQDVEHLGFKDELVNVKAGYGRNYLLPKGMAVVATESAKKVLNETLKQRANKEEKLIEEANKTAEALQEADIKIKTKVGEKGRIYGAVTNNQLADTISEMGYDVDRKKIKILGSQIKEVGEYQAEIRLHREVDTKIDFEVVAEE